MVVTKAANRGTSTLRSTVAVPVVSELGRCATRQSLSQTASTVKSWFTVFSDLFKARLTFLVLLTTLVGFYVGYRGLVDYLLMLHMLLGTTFVAGAAALNQLWERTNP